MTIYRAHILTWLALLGLLAAMVAVANLAPEAARTPAVLLLATVMASLVLAVFMGLRHMTGLMRVIALGGFLWLGLMIVLTLADYLTR